ncbi:hypothetical protein PanWU01x14_274420 [Parasponia andersonii]|uniref:Uncharacterized protein n=1 Tax=Parasponia andersonii TaxID=3476 RepID=A0A2P5B3I8_PARAD|nr:hypothetical protein PanWU01x14_274420 [Parasponia andersonii]
MVKTSGGVEFHITMVKTSGGVVSKKMQNVSKLATSAPKVVAPVASPLAKLVPESFEEVAKSAEDSSQAETENDDNFEEEATAKAKDIVKEARDDEGKKPIATKDATSKSSKLDDVVITVKATSSVTSKKPVVKKVVASKSSKASKVVATTSEKVTTIVVHVLSVHACCNNSIKNCNNFDGN